MFRKDYIYNVIFIKKIKIDLKSIITIFRDKIEPKPNPHNIIKCKNVPQSRNKKDE